MTIFFLIACLKSGQVKDRLGLLIFSVKIDIFGKLKIDDMALLAVVHFF